MTVTSVMLWNEPNNLSHWDRTLDPEWRRFAEMTRIAGRRVREVAPDVTRVLGGISPVDPHFIALLASYGTLEEVDVVGVHGFPLDWNRWDHREWGERVARVREAAGLPVWATEVGASSLASETLQAWAVDAILGELVPHVERTYWYSMMDLSDSWEACTRHRSTEGSAYFRHFRMGVLSSDGREKPAARRLASWAGPRVGVCEWAYWNEPERLGLAVSRMRALGIQRLRTGIGWADWMRPGALEWFDRLMREVADLDVSLTLCFTPSDEGLRPHWTSPPRDVSRFADFCEQVLRRYVVAPERELAEAVA